MVPGDQAPVACGCDQPLVLTSPPWSIHPVFLTPTPRNHIPKQTTGSQARASGPAVKRMRGGRERARKWGHGEQGQVRLGVSEEAEKLSKTGGEWPEKGAGGVAAHAGPSGQGRTLNFNPRKWEATKGLSQENSRGQDVFWTRPK